MFIKCHSLALTLSNPSCPCSQSVLCRTVHDCLLNMHAWPVMTNRSTCTASVVIAACLLAVHPHLGSRLSGRRCLLLPVMCCAATWGSLCRCTSAFPDQFNDGVKWHSALPDMLAHQPICASVVDQVQSVQLLSATLIPCSFVTVMYWTEQIPPSYCTTQVAWQSQQEAHRCAYGICWEVVGFCTG